jgi:mycothiol synthase
VTPPGPAGHVPPAGYTVRAAHRGDFDRVVALIRAADIADWGEPDFTAEHLRVEWSLRDLDLATDTWLVEGETEACGYGWLLGRANHRQLDGWLVVHPEHRGRGIGEWLLDLADRRAAEHAGAAPAGSPVVIHQNTIEPDREIAEILTSGGYRRVRSSFEMRVRLQPPVDQRRVPDGIQVRTFDRGRDARAVHAALEAAFADHFGYVPHPFEEWVDMRIASPHFDQTLWFLALDGPRVAGALIGSIEEGVGWVHSLGVVPERRGRGIGECLLRRSFAAFAGRGVVEVTLEVDAQNETGAVALYERVGMHEHRRYLTFERRLVGSAVTGEAEETGEGGAEAGP